MPRKPLPDPVEPPVDEEELDIAIVFLRVALRWKQKDLAGKSGIGNSSISDYERRKKNPGRKNLRKILQAMGYRESVLELTHWYLNELRTTQRLAPGEHLPNELQLPAAPGPTALAVPRSQIDQVPADFGRVAEQVVRLFVDLLKAKGAGSLGGGTPGLPETPESPG